jgi:hypothetical protein
MEFYDFIVQKYEKKSYRQSKRIKDSAALCGKNKKTGEDGREASSPVCGVSIHEGVNQLASSR